MNAMAFALLWVGNITAWSLPIRCVMWWGDSMPIVEKELVRAYLLSDTHDNRAVV